MGAPGVDAQGGRRPGDFVLGTLRERRDWNRFDEAYARPALGLRDPRAVAQPRSPVVRGPVTYTGQEALARDIANLKAALEAAGIEEGWMNAVAPASCARIANEHYATDEELLYAFADAMREEYAAIIDAGLILQLDDPAIAENWDQTAPEPSVEAYKRYTMIRIDALNHAIRGLPPERIRFHLCWGSWHGPHFTDLPMADLVDVMLAVNAGAYSFEAANARHEHEWRLWEDVEAARGQGDHARRRQPRDERGRAPRARRRPHRPLREGGRARARRRLDRLRPGRARAPADRVGEARGARAGRGARVQAPVALSARDAQAAARSCVSGSSARPTWHESQSGAPISWRRSGSPAAASSCSALGNSRWTIQRGA